MSARKTPAVKCRSFIDVFFSRDRPRYKFLPMKKILKTSQG
jgi:hypothetical protein